MNPRIEKLKEDNKTHSENLRWDANRIMGMAAIFISILSMIAVIYQSYLAREENELTRIQQSATVLPYLSNWYSDTEGEFKFIIGNKGVGPAFVKEVKFTAINFEGKDSIFFDNSDYLIGYLKQQSVLLDSIPSTASTFKENTLLSQDEIKEIVVFSYDNNSQSRLIRKEFNKYVVGFKIVYEDVYGAAWVLNSDEGFPIKLKND